MTTASSSAEALATDQWREEGPWLLLLLLPIAALAFRRGWALVLLIFVLPLPKPVEASLWDDLWQNKNQQASKQLGAGNAEDAAALFEDSEWRAVARYRAKDFAGSAAEFAERGDARNLYNLGNAMAFQGELNSAIDAYEQVLEMQPDNEDAAYNLELIKNLKDQQQQQQQDGEGDQQQSGENQEGEGEQSDSESQPGHEGSEGSSESQDESQESDTSQRGDEEMSDEDLEALQQELQRAAEEAQTGEMPQQLSAAELAELREQQEQEQAMEQWLRRIPDDPGGLLRRKFRHQYQRSGKDQDGNDVWPDNEAQPW